MSETVAGWVAAAREHPRHLVLGGLVAGLLAGSAPGWAVPLALLGFVLAAAPAGRARPALGLAVALAVTCGSLFAGARLESRDRTALRPLLGADVRVTGVLLESPRRGAWGTRRALVRITRGRGKGERVLVRAARWPRLDSGAELEAAGRLAALGPGEGWQRRRGAHARLFADAVRATGRRRGGPPGLLDRVRRAAEGAVGAGLDRPRAALARGMVLGEDEALSERVREDFRASGLAHLLAASGQNVMLLVALALPVLAALGLGRRGRLVGALGLVALYVPLAGGGPSVQRAGVMGGAGLVALLAGRPASRWYALLLAAAVTLGRDPRAAADPGWQLSFAAVLSILALARRLAAALSARRVPGPIADALALTATATLGTAPLLAFHFGRLSLVSLPANLLAVPAVAPAMWLGMLAAGLGLALPPAATAVNALSRFPLAYLEWLAGAAASLPHASVPLRLGSAAAVAAAYAGLGAIAAAGRRALPLAVVGAALLLVGSQPRTAAPPDPRDVVVSFLDIGQGDATLVQHGGATLLFDAGPPGAPVLQRLREAGVKRVDLLVVTHAQADHEGGVPEVLDELDVGTVLDGAAVSEHPALARAMGSRRRRALAGQEIRAGPLAVRVLWPPPDADRSQDPNLRAVVALISAGDFDLLLPADAESEVTAGLTLPRVEALKVAHHGSEDPGLPDLLRRTHPSVAAIEVGRGNRYGHPTAATLSELRAAVPAVFRTDHDGMVTLRVHAGRMTVATHP